MLRSFALRQIGFVFSKPYSDSACLSLLIPAGQHNMLFLTPFREMIAVTPFLE
jgi:hypothetical protein